MLRAVGCGQCVKGYMGVVSVLRGIWMWSVR